MKYIPFHPSIIIGNDCGNLRLLQHNFRNPNFIVKGNAPKFDFSIASDWGALPKFFVTYDWGDL